MAVVLELPGFLKNTSITTTFTSFVRKYGTSASTRANPGTFTVELINDGTNNGLTPGIEATLDMEYSKPFTGSLPVVYLRAVAVLRPSVQTGSYYQLTKIANEPYLEWAEYMLAKPDGAIPRVVSISYTDTEQGVPRDYATHVCDLFGRLAARGVSIIDASGDGAAAGHRDFDCVSNDGLTRPTFMPTFPVSCPWVTSLGRLVIFSQQAASFSSGGFPN